MEDEVASDAVVSDRVDEGLVNLEQVEFEFLQSGKVRVACAEIVDGDAEAHLSKLRDGLKAGTLDKTVFRGFDDEITWGSSTHMQQVIYPVYDSGRLEVRRRYV